MKKNALVLSIAIAALLILGVYSFKSANSHQDDHLFKPQGPVSHKEDPAHPSAPLTKEDSLKAQASLKAMSQTLLEFTVQEKQLGELMTSLQQAQQEPYQVKDENPYTGEMIIVRTKSPLPGTRYFHAQYFTDDNNKSFAQHMSFEFRPSPEAMEQAIAMVQATFPGLGTPMEESRDFVQWELPHGYVVWVKRLDQQDIANNPFNGYNQGDIGSIRIAVELNPEAEGDHANH